MTYTLPAAPPFPYLAYERAADGSTAMGSLETTHTSLLWTLEPGSKRELLFLAFMMEFMPPQHPQDPDNPPEDEPE